MSSAADGVHDPAEPPRDRRPRLRLLRRTTLLALGAAMLWAGPAAAATLIQIGQISPGSREACSAGNIPQLATGAAPTFAVPSNGVITEWSHNGRAAFPGSGRLQIWRSSQRSVVHWLRRLVFRGAWLDQRVKEGELEIVFDDPSIRSATSSPTATVGRSSSHASPPGRPGIPALSAPRLG